MWLVATVVGITPTDALVVMCAQEEMRLDKGFLKHEGFLIS